jgi:hypothetical protein
MNDGINGIVKETINDGIKDVVKETINELERQGKIKNPSDKTPYQRTEALLYNLNSFYEAVEFHYQQIEILKSEGAPKKSKSITSFVANSGLREQKDETEIVEEKIEDEKKVIYRTRLLLGIVENAIRDLPDDKCPEIIELIYRDGKSIECVADEVGKSHVTVAKYRNIMVKTIATRLFPDDTIKDILY